MATFYQNKDLIISVDPGYDATKIVINGVLFSVPNNILDITGQTKDFLTLGENKKRGYLCAHYIEGKEHLVGDLARKSIMEKKIRDIEMTKYQMMDSYERFRTQAFEINMMTAIGYAIVEYAKETMKKNWKPELTIIETYIETKDGHKKKIYKIPSLKDWKIIVGVTLPHDISDMDSPNCVWPDIKKFLVNKHKFSIDINAETYELDFEIIPGHAMPISQVIAALLGVAENVDGWMDENKNLDLEKLPVIVIDGGYKTVGIFMLTKAIKVSGAESNTEFAMGNVHKEVVNLLKEEYEREIEPYQIPYILNEEGGKINCLVTGSDGEKTVETVDVQEMVYASEEALCEKLIEYLNKKFDNLLNVKHIIITGGTGSAYYEHFNKYIGEKRRNLKDSIILTDYKFKGKKIDPVYAIAIGMYETLNNQLIKSYKKAEEGAKAKKVVKKEE